MGCRELSRRSFYVGKFSILVGAILSEQLAGAMGTAMLGVQTIAIGAQLLGCCPVYGVIAMAVGAVCVAFATAEAQEALGYGNWLKDTVGMSDEVYNGVMIATIIAAIAINIVGVKQCFKEGTLVACLDENGEEIQKPIESIAVGTLVLAYDELTGEKAYKPVLRLSRNATKEWYHVHVNGEEIVCTGGHPFYVLNADENRDIVCYEGVKSCSKGKWIAAKDLQISDKLLLSDGTYVIIEAIDVESLETAETTYNFEVECFHTYYVSESNVLVHNMCKPESPKKLNDQYLKKNNIDAHKFKKSILGKKAKISRYDIFVDTVDDSLWLGTKLKGSMQWIETFETLSGLGG